MGLDGPRAFPREPLLHLRLLSGTVESSGHLLSSDTSVLPSDDTSFQKPATGGNFHPDSIRWVTLMWICLSSFQIGRKPTRAGMHPIRKHWKLRENCKVLGKQVLLPRALKKWHHLQRDSGPTVGPSLSMPGLTGPRAFMEPRPLGSVMSKLRQLPHVGNDLAFFCQDECVHTPQPSTHC